MWPSAHVLDDFSLDLALDQIKGKDRFLPGHLQPLQVNPGQFMFLSAMWNYRYNELFFMRFGSEGLISSERGFDMRNYSQLSRGMIITVALVLAILASQASADDLQLLESQLIALELSGELRPPAGLTELILDDLAAIRGAYPQVADIRYKPSAVPDQLIVGLTDQAMAQFNDGQYHELDDLNALYGVIDIDASPLSPAMVLTFDQIYHTQVLSDLYIQAQPWGLRYAEPNGYIGGGSTIQANPPFYTFIRAWGDCPSGCIHHRNSHFRVDDGQVTFIPEPSSLALLALGLVGFVGCNRKCNRPRAKIA